MHLAGWRYLGERTSPDHNAVDADADVRTHSTFVIAEAVFDPGELLFELVDHLADVFCFELNLSDTVGKVEQQGGNVDGWHKFEGSGLALLITYTPTTSSSSILNAFSPNATG